MPQDNSLHVAEEHAQQAVSPALRRRLQQCFEHGNKLAGPGTYDYDYVHSLFQECVVQDPGNPIYVDAMLSNLARKFNNNKKGSRLAMFVGRSAFKKSVAKKSWAEILRLGPELLKHNPWDKSILRPLAEASAVFGHIESELKYLRFALDGNPKDPELNRHCANSLTRLGNFDQAIACWHRVEEALPNDPEPPRRISDLQTEKARTRPASDVAKSKSGVTIPKSVARGPANTPEPNDSSSASRREIELTPRQRLEQSLSIRPTDIDLYVELAALHVEEGKLVDAQRVLTKALAVSGNNFRIQDKLDDVHIMKLKEQLAIAEHRANNGPPDSRQLVDQLQSELNRVELEVFGRRSQRHPNDPQIRFELALRLKRTENYSEAVKQLQTLTGNAAFHVPAALEIGECFQRLRQFGKAIQLYQNVLELATGTDQIEPRKTALYRTGVLAAAMSDPELARKMFETLLELAPEYKDARTRLDKLAEIRDKV